MGQQVPGFGGNGLVQATEQMVSLQLSRPPGSQVHVLQLFGYQVDPSGCVSFKWSMHEARQRHICGRRNTSVLFIVIQYFKMCSFLFLYSCISIILILIHSIVLFSFIPRVK